MHALQGLQVVSTVVYIQEILSIFIQWAGYEIRQDLSDILSKNSTNWHQKKCQLIVIANPCKENTQKKLYENFAFIVFWLLYTFIYMYFIFCSDNIQSDDLQYLTPVNPLDLEVIYVYLG